tara:strand:- start:5205 stop:5954 length:750 start_codon:yes stop_codon:yes gene_type:complete
MESKDKIINKSLLSNAVALILVIVGYLMVGPYQVYVLNTGLFALSGGVTNWLAVHMLFERVPGLYGSGVVELRFEEFKYGIRGLIMEQFFNHGDLSAFFQQTGQVADRLNEHLKGVTEDLNLDSAFDSLLEVIMSSSFSGMLGMLGGKEALSPLKAPFVERMRDYFRSQFANQTFQSRLENALRGALDEGAIRHSVAELIDRRLDEMTPKMVKEIVQQMIYKHLGWLVIWGCAFGGMMGLAVTLLNSLT